MSNAVSIAGTAYGHISTFHGVAGDFVAYPPLGSGPVDHGPESDFLLIHFTGDNKTYTKNLGFMGRDLEVPLLHIAATHDLCLAAKAAVITNCTGVDPRITVIFAGVTYTGCVLKRNGAVDQKIFPISGLCALQVL